MRPPLLAIAFAVTLGAAALLQAEQAGQGQTPTAPGTAPAAPSPPAGAVNVLHVQKNVHMLVGPNGNSTLQAGNDGLIVVDVMEASVAPQLLAAIRRVSDRPIHSIINTHLHADHTGGNDALVKQRGTGATQGVRVIAQDNVLTRMIAASSASKPVSNLRLNAVIELPINSSYFTPSRDFFLNGEAVILHHVPAAHTDGDTIVHFRGSDVISTGDVFRPDLYPVIDLQNGGSVQGLIAALNRILEITVPAKYQEGGTLVIPGHGRLCDEAEVVEYRDMVTIIRDRVQDLIKKGRTLQQVKAARPTLDYDTEFGAQSGAWTTDMFVEAVYRSLGGK